MNAKELIAVLQKYPSYTEVCSLNPDIGITTEVTGVDFDAGETVASKAEGYSEPHPSIVLRTTLID